MILDKNNIMFFTANWVDMQNKSASYKQEGSSLYLPVMRLLVCSEITVTDTRTIQP